MMSVKKIVPSILLLILTACSTPTEKLKHTSGQCETGDMAIQTTLYFGLSRPEWPNITSNEWQSFVDHKVTPRFRDGLTVFSADGQWLGNNGKVVREQSKALMLIHGISAGENKNIEDIRKDYQNEFHQESVMRVDQPVCAAF